MKRITALALFTAATTLAAGNALAQIGGVKATMPFSFIVGNKVLPTGTYTIIPATDTTVAIQDWDKHVSVLSNVSQDSEQSKNGAELVFDKFGDKYVLREVLGGSAGALNVNLPLSKSEERVRKQEVMAHNQSQISIPASEG